jgi:benzil reductase ((S)-benzoin forming)
MRLALITGGSRGLGLALVEQLQQQGYAVIDFSRSAPHAFSVAVDLSDPAAYSRLLKRTLDGVDCHALAELVVINNAGTLDPIGPAAAKDPAQLIANLNTNLTSGIIFIAQVVAQFQAARCRKIIANISSGAALKGYAGWSLYCAAKAGTENFIRALAVEQHTEAAPFVAINVNPGVIDTEMQASIRAAPAADFPDVSRFIQRHEQGELNAPSVVASAVLAIVAQENPAAGERYACVDFIV